MESQQSVKTWKSACWRISVLKSDFGGSGVPSRRYFMNFVTVFSSYHSMVAADPDRLFLISGNGDVIEPDDGILAIGSGGPYAQAAASALVLHSDLDAEAIARSALEIAGSICVYTNQNIIIEKI